jgi:hypothetical protein
MRVTSFVSGFCIGLLIIGSLQDTVLPDQPHVHHEAPSTEEINFIPMPFSPFTGGFSR